MLIPFRETVFIKSVAELSQLPPDEGREIAFAGRSNAGKSTALNAVTGVNKLAKTSKTPGRTQTINLFKITDHWRLVDLPGYGYAKVPRDMKVAWDKVLSSYLQTRDCLKGLCLVMDARHPLQSFDQHMIEWAKEAKLPLHILFSKADKLTQSEKMKLKHEHDKIFNKEELISFQLFSALRKEGIEDARKKISQWLLN